MQLQPGQFYQRADLHAHFGGQRQGGIVTPKAHPVILLFSSPKGEAYGYRDGWLEDRDLYLYSGEGTEGDMTFLRVLLDPDPWGVKKEGVLCLQTGSTPRT